MSAKRTSEPLTLQEIARLAGTSKSTVSRVLSHHPKISEATRQRVGAVIDKHGFRPNLFARALAVGRTGQIGVLSSNISSGFFAEVIRGIDMVSQEHGGHLVCSFAHGVADYMKLWRELTHSGQVDGLILIDPPLELFGETCDARRLPLVLCASRPPGRAGGWSRVDTVTVDNRKVMGDIVAHLAERGCRRLLHLAGPVNTHDSLARRAAFEAAARARRTVQAVARTGHLTQDDGRRAGAAIATSTDPLPDAIVAFNDSTALGVLEAFRSRPDPRLAAVRLTGWDDTPAAPILGLTSVQMPMTELGQESARLLYRRVKDKGAARTAAQHRLIAMKLVVRASSAPA